MNRKVFFDAVLSAWGIPIEEFAEAWSREIRRIAAGAMPPCPPEGVIAITAELAHRLMPSSEMTS